MKGCRCLLTIFSGGNRVVFNQTPQGCATLRTLYLLPGGRPIRDIPSNCLDDVQGCANLHALFFCPRPGNLGDIVPKDQLGIDVGKICRAAAFR
jgi:hypothetical protein